MSATRALLLSCIALLLAAAPARAADRPFSDASIWNAPLPANTPVDPRSPSYVNRLLRSVLFTGAYMNTTRYSVPVYTVPADQPTVKVTLDHDHDALEKALSEVPLPDDAAPAEGTDGNLVVSQPSTDTMWEFYRLTRQEDGWHTGHGGRMSDVSKSPGFYAGAQRRWGASASSLPLLGGLVRLDELREGHIDHALAMAVPAVKANVFAWPAQRTDGTSLDPSAIPEGLRFRLHPGLDLSKLHLSPVVRMLAEAAQKYGIIVRDGGSNVAFYGEDPTPTGTNPYPELFGGRYINQVLISEFPWTRLYVPRAWLIDEEPSDVRGHDAA